jgi:hypothetical protein
MNLCLLLELHSLAIEEKRRMTGELEFEVALKALVLFETSLGKSGLGGEESARTSF